MQRASNGVVCPAIPEACRLPDPAPAVDRPDRQLREGGKPPRDPIDSSQPPWPTTMRLAVWPVLEPVGPGDRTTKQALPSARTAADLVQVRCREVAGVIIPSLRRTRVAEITSGHGDSIAQTS
jgi:hypothetical protein